MMYQARRNGEEESGWGQEAGSGVFEMRALAGLCMCTALTYPLLSRARQSPQSWAAPRLLTTSCWRGRRRLARGGGTRLRASSSIQARIGPQQQLNWNRHRGKHSRQAGPLGCCFSLSAVECSAAQHPAGSVCILTHWTTSPFLAVFP